MAVEHTYEKQLGWKNLDKVPAKSGPNKGKVSEWFTKNGIITMIPDDWANMPVDGNSRPDLFQPLPKGTHAIKMTTDEEVIVT